MTAASDISYCRFCAKAVRRRGRRVVAEMKCVGRDRDTAAVHDMRVACRRLRSAIVTLRPCLPKKADRWQKELRRATRALTQARDLDVQIEFVELFSRQPRRPAAWQPGLIRLLDELRRHRQAAQKKVEQALKTLARTKVPAEIERTTSKLLRDSAGGAAVSRAARQRSAAAIEEVLDKMVSYRDCVAKPDAAAEQHRMRIAAKRLRYTMEIFEPLYGGRLRRPLAAARKLQTVLGDLHDCDVWLASLAILSPNRQGAPAGAVVPAAMVALPLAGLDALCRNRQRRRPVLYRQFVRTWTAMQQAGTWTSLRHTLNSAELESRPTKPFAQN